MQKVKNLGPGGEDVFSCVDLIRSGDAVKGNGTDLHVMGGVSLQEATSSFQGAGCFKWHLFVAFATKLLGQS